MNQKKIRHCARCSGACEERVLDTVAGEAAPLRLIVHGMPAQVCVKGHKAPVDGDFMLRLIHGLRSREAQFAAGKEQGMLFKKYMCADCGKELPAKPERRQAFPFDLAEGEARPYKVKIEVPLYKCVGCGKEQLRSIKDLRGHIPAAVVAVNDEAGFPHSG